MSEEEKIDETVKEFLENADDVIKKQDEVKPVKPEEKPKKTKGRKAATISLISAFVAIFLLCFILVPRQTKRSPFLPVPYVFNQRFHKILTKFALTKGHSQVLVITGPKGIGKARGLQEFISRNNNTQNLPIFLNFESLSKLLTANDFKQFLMQSLSTALKSVDGEIFINQTILSQQLPYLSGVSTKCPQQYVAQLNDQNLVKIADVAYGILNFEEKEDSFVSHSVFNFFEFIDRTSPALGTYILASDPTKIINAKDKAARDAVNGFVQFMMNYGKGEYQVPTVVSVHNILAKNVKFMTRNPSIFRVFIVDEFDTKEATDLLVKKEKVFTKKQMNDLISNFGGFGEHYAIAHDMNLEKKSISETYEMLRDSYVKRIIKATEEKATKQMLKDRIAFLTRLKKKGSASVDDFEEASRHFISHGIVKILDNGKVDYINHDITVVPANKVVYYALNVAIKNLQ